MQVQDIMTPNPFCVVDEDTASTLDKVMFEHNIRHVPVVDRDRKIVGVLSNRDLLAKLPPSFAAMDTSERKYYLDLIRIDAFSLAEPVAVLSSTSVLEAVKAMQYNKVGSLPVVDEESRLVGIVTGGDFLNALIWTLEGKKPHTMRVATSDPNGSAA